MFNPTTVGGKRAVILLATAIIFGMDNLLLASMPAVEYAAYVIALVATYLMTAIPAEDPDRHRKAWVASWTTFLISIALTFIALFALTSMLPDGHEAREYYGPWIMVAIVPTYVAFVSGMTMITTGVVLLITTLIRNSRKES